MGGEQFVPMGQFRETHDAWQEALVACEQAESRERELAGDLEAAHDMRRIEREAHESRERELVAATATIVRWIESLPYADRPPHVGKAAALLSNQDRPDAEQLEP